MSSEETAQQKLQRVLKEREERRKAEDAEIKALKHTVTVEKRTQLSTSITAKEIEEGKRKDEVMSVLQEELIDNAEAVNEKDALGEYQRLREDGDEEGPVDGGHFDNILRSRFMDYLRYYLFDYAIKDKVQTINDGDIPTIKKLCKNAGIDTKQFLPTAYTGASRDGENTVILTRKQNLRDSFHRIYEKELRGEAPDKSGPKNRRKEGEGAFSTNEVETYALFNVSTLKKVRTLEENNQYIKGMRDIYKFILSDDVDDTESDEEVRIASLFDFVTVCVVPNYNPGETHTIGYKSNVAYNYRACQMIAMLLLHNIRKFQSYEKLMEFIYIMLDINVIWNDTCPEDDDDEESIWFTEMKYVHGIGIGALFTYTDYALGSDNATMVYNTFTTKSPTYAFLSKMNVDEHEAGHFFDMLARKISGLKENPVSPTSKIQRYVTTFNNIHDEMLKGVIKNVQRHFGINRIFRRTKLKPIKVPAAFIDLVYNVYISLIGPESEHAAYGILLLRMLGYNIQRKKLGFVVTKPILQEIISRKLRLDYFLNTTDAVEPSIADMLGMSSVKNEKGKNDRRTLQNEEDVVLWPTPFTDSFRNIDDETYGDFDLGIKWRPPINPNDAERLSHGRNAYNMLGSILGSEIQNFVRAVSVVRSRVLMTHRLKYPEVVKGEDDKWNDYWNIVHAILTPEQVDDEIVAPVALRMYTYTRYTISSFLKRIQTFLTLYDLRTDTIKSSDSHNYAKTGGYPGTSILFVAYKIKLILLYVMYEINNEPPDYAKLPEPVTVDENNKLQAGSKNYTEYVERILDNITSEIPVDVSDSYNDYVKRKEKAMADDHTTMTANPSVVTMLKKMPQFLILLDIVLDKLRKIVKLVQVRNEKLKEDVANESLDSLFVAYNANKLLAPEKDRLIHLLYNFRFAELKDNYYRKYSEDNGNKKTPSVRRPSSAPPVVPYDDVNKYVTDKINRITKSAKAHWKKFLDNWKEGDIVVDTVEDFDDGEEDSEGGEGEEEEGEESGDDDDNEDTSSSSSSSSSSEGPESDDDEHDTSAASGINTRTEQDGTSKPPIKKKQKLQLCLKCSLPHYLPPERSERSGAF
jgi:hypothetical protein